MRKLTIALISALALSSCTNTTQTGISNVNRSQLLLVSSQAIDEASAKQYEQVISEAKAQGKLNVNKEQTQRVKNISQRLIKAAPYFRADCKDWNWQVNVISSKEVNAWCMAGGKIAVYTGLIDELKPTDDELAVVIGHEIAHALREHVRENASQALLTQGAVQIASIFAGDLAGQLSGAVATYGINLPFSRKNEQEADEIGLELIARAGFDVDAGVSLWQKMSKLTGSNTSEFFSTHPSDENRQKDLEQLAAKLKALGYK